MNLSHVLLLSIWIFFSFCLFSPVILSRPDSTVSSISVPGLSLEGKKPISFSQFSAQMEAQSPGMPVVVVQHQDLNKRILIALIVASSLLGGILLFLLFFCLCRQKKLKKPNLETKENIDAVNTTSNRSSDRFSSLRMAGRKGSIAVIEYQFLEAATNNFQESNILGECGQGRLYRGSFDETFLAAIKRLDGGGQDVDREFENELKLLSKVQHPNIINLLGYSIHGRTKLLVYEMMQNGSLENQLHGHSGGSVLTWPLRLKIAVDIARGLEYLHEHCSPPVIHRDLKSSNILLDSSFNAKLSDFGLAVFSGTTQNKPVKLSGTLSYVAPEYLLDGKLTDKSDVYSFGVILLELLMGRKAAEKVSPSQCQSIVTWAMPQLTDRAKLPKIVDPAIKDQMDLKHLYQVAAVAVLCVQPEPSYRPLITDVLHSLIPLLPVEHGGSLRIA
ncbi:probable receptor-like protein kinase At1g80640 [Carica papaya]|uniref:probable receptor-like protein kinase At1g80640 n=1 Tax=Carica papaya TaxID=3649 RepID=UPI000B8CB3C2|nr:probable receptor-like protein kinase At1g80640 [Carica papaya]